jgi:hypothetical protein
MILVSKKYANSLPNARFFNSGLLAVVSLAMLIFSSTPASALPLTTQRSWEASAVLQSSEVRFDDGFQVNGIIALSNCSGSLVRFKNSSDDAKGIILTNGHCAGGLFGGMLKPGEVYSKKARHFSVKLLSKTGSSVASLSADTILYATMTDTDVSLLQLNQSYRDIKKATGVDALVLADQKAAPGTPIQIASGYWKRTYSCQIDGYVNSLKEGDWLFKDSLRYSNQGCDVIGGTSGSPIISSTSGEVVGVNNTINEDGASCTVNNPCEIDVNGKVTVVQGRGYGQETYQFYSCLNAAREFDLATPGCVLPQGK